MDKNNVSSGKVFDIHLAENKFAKTVRVDPANFKAAECQQLLALSMPDCVILVIGSTADIPAQTAASIKKFYRRILLPLAREYNALIVDGGTRAGIIQLLGETISNVQFPLPVLGVAPAGKVDYDRETKKDQQNDATRLDPGHSRFVLVESDQWGGETDTMFALLKHFAAQAPVIAFVIGGGEITRNEVRRCAENGWPIVLVKGSGRLADELINNAETSDRNAVNLLRKTDALTIPVDAEDTDAAKNKIAKRLRSDELLKQAWAQFSWYDHNANKRQKSFKRMQFWILLLGILTTFFALSESQIEKWLLGKTVAAQAKTLTDYRAGNKPPADSHLQLRSMVRIQQWNRMILHNLVIILPILLSILIAAANRFKAGQKWLLLRSVAERIKQQIYYYRASAGIYSGPPHAANMERRSSKNRRALFGDAIAAITLEALRRDPLLGAEPPASPAAIPGTEADDGVSPLCAETYRNTRLKDQLAYFNARIARLHRRLTLLNWAIIGLGGLGALLAAVNLGHWVPLMGAIGAAILTALEYQKVEATLAKSTEARNELLNIETWWKGLTPAEQQQAEKRNLLVINVEETLEQERRDWQSTLNAAMSKFREDSLIRA